jgi:hypothetical protein
MVKTTRDENLSFLRLDHLNLELPSEAVTAAVIAEADHDEVEEDTVTVEVIKVDSGVEISNL